MDLTELHHLVSRGESSYRGEISLAIYDDRMEILNGGSLLEGLEVEDLKKNHKSIRRNKLVADAFYYAGLIERWGRGTQKIIELCKQANLPEPEFISNRQGFSVIFRAQIKALGLKRISVPSWSSRRHEIYDFIAKRDQTSIQDLELAFPNILKRTLQKDLFALKGRNYIVQRGSGKTSYWILQPEPS